MSLEAALAELTAAVNANTAIRLGEDPHAVISTGAKCSHTAEASCVGSEEEDALRTDACAMCATGQVSPGAAQALCRRYLMGIGRTVEEAAARRAKVRAAMAHLENDSVYYLFEHWDRLRLYTYLTCWMAGVAELEFSEIDQSLRDGRTVASIRDGLLARQPFTPCGSQNGGGKPEDPGPDVSVGPYCEAILRHLSGWWNGERLSAGTSIHHLAHIVACCAVLIDAENENRMIDDRELVLPDLRRLLAAFPAPRHRGEVYVDQVHLELSELWLCVS